MDSIHSLVEICNHHNDIGPFLRDAIKELRRIAGVREAGIALASRISYVDHIATEGIRQQIEELGTKPVGIKLKKLRKSVLSGTTDERLPYFSSRGSFFSNDVQALLDGLTQTNEPIDSIFHRTMAFIPIYAQTKVIGIIELADHKVDALSPSQVRTLERAATCIGQTIQRIRAERLLKIAEERFRMLMDQSNAAILINLLDENGQPGRFIEANKIACQALGYSRNELRSLTPSNLDRSRGQLNLSNLLAQLKKKQYKHFEMLETTNSGQRVHRKVNAELLRFDDQGAVLTIIRELSQSQNTEHQLHLTLSRLHRSMLGTFNAMAKVFETKDPYTQGHQKRVAKIACLIAKHMGFEQDRIDGLRIASTLHDIGKIYIPAEILVKPGSISAREFNLIKSHCQYGYEILKGVDFPWPVAKMVLQHHEKMDGSGYPSHLPGNNIMLEARILSVADSIEAMLSERPYRPALDCDRACGEIARYQGRLFDPQVVDVCLDLHKRGELSQIAN